MRTILVIVHPYAPNMGEYSAAVLDLAKKTNIDVLIRVNGKKDDMIFYTNNPISEIKFKYELKKIIKPGSNRYTGQVLDPKEIERLYKEYC